METPAFQTIDDNLRVRIENFNSRLNAPPNQNELQKTPDGKANSFPISFVEMTLDEMFFGLWSTENFQWSAIQNEVQGSLELVVLHPVTGFTIRRTGAASIIIMVDKVPDSIKDDNQRRNSWSTDVSNKKPNALDLGFPKLKAECLKNAALSLGKAFGRDINRKVSDVYNPLITGSNQSMTRAITAAIEAGNHSSAKMLVASSRLPVEIKEEFLLKITA